jgi:hypothetical protein
MQRAREARRTSNKYETEIVRRLSSPHVHPVQQQADMTFARGSGGKRTTTPRHSARVRERSFDSDLSG